MDHSVDCFEGLCYQLTKAAAADKSPPCKACGQVATAGCNHCEGWRTAAENTYPGALGLLQACKVRHAAL